MSVERDDLPTILAPPLGVDASFDIDVSLAFDVEWLGAETVSEAAS